MSGPVGSTPKGEPTLLPEDRRLVWKSLLPFLTVNLPLAFLFLDFANLNDNIYTGNLLSLGLDPYRYGGTVIAGYPALPYVQLTYAAYVQGGSSLLAADVVPKLVILGATYLSGIVLLRIARAEGFPRPRLIFLAFVFNPFLTFINVVWGETDALVILGLVSGYALLRYGARDPIDYPAVVLGVVAILWTGFSYYAPLVLIPTFLAYLPTRSSTPRTLALLVGLGGVLAVPPILLRVTASAPTGLAAGRAGANVFSVANLFVTSPDLISASTALAAIIAIVVLAFALPIVLRRWVPAPVTLFLVFAFALSLTFGFVQGDNVVLLVPLLYLAAIALPAGRWTVARLALAQAFLVPQFFVVEMWNGPGGVAGIPYWGWFVLHSQFSFYDLFGGLTGWRVLLGLYLAGLCATALGLLYLSRRSTDDIVAPAGTRTASPPSPGRPRLSRSEVAVVLVAIGAVAAIGIPFTGAGTVSPAYTVSGGLPAMTFNIVYPLNPGVPLPSASAYTFSPGSGSLTAYASSLGVALVRNVSDQADSLTFTATVPNPGEFTWGRSLPFFATDHDSLAFTARWERPAFGATISPSNASTSTPIAGSSPVIANVTRLFPMGPTQSVTWQVRFSPGSAEAIFAAYLGAAPNGGERLWQLTSPTCNLSADLVNGTVTLGRERATPTSVPIIAPMEPGDWLMLGLAPAANGTGLNVSIDGSSSTVVGCYPNLAAISVGGALRPPFGSESSTMVGDVTDLFLGSLSSEIPSVGWSLTESGVPSPLARGSERTVTVSLEDSEDRTTAYVNGVPLSLPGSTTYWEVGKLEPVPVTLVLTFQLTQWARATGTPDVGPEIVTFAVGPPAVAVAWYGLRRWTPRRSQSSPDRSPE